jgi:hypothetical protein
LLTARAPRSHVVMRGATSCSCVRPYRLLFILFILYNPSRRTEGILTTWKLLIVTTFRIAGGRRAHAAVS